MMGIECVYSDGSKTQLRLRQSASGLCLTPPTVYSEPALPTMLNRWIPLTVLLMHIHLCYWLIICMS